MSDLCTSAGNPICLIESLIISSIKTPGFPLSHGKS